MTYSIIGILAVFVLVIINRDVLWNRDHYEFTPAQENYRKFLLGVLCYYITDLLWGILESNHLIPILYADTVVHFAAMVGAVMLWTKYGSVLEEQPINRILDDWCYFSYNERPEKNYPAMDSMFRGRGNIL